jgi:SAM-dependent methyltransferase
MGEATIYSDGSYLRRNPDWHSADSRWKASQIARMLLRNNLVPRRVCEVGCGAGEVLVQLAGHLPITSVFDGYDISPDAHSIASRKSTDRIRFHLADFMTAGSENFDLGLAIDVFEHVEDYFTFLRNFRALAHYKIFHIPLELSALMVVRRRPLIHQRRSVGHLHHFGKETALATLEDTGYRVVDFFYTSERTELDDLGWKTKLLAGPRRALAALSPDLAARTLGGYSLLVMAE